MYSSSGILTTTPPIIPEKKVRILLVPGHEPSEGGTQFGSIYERNLTVELAKNLQNLLNSDGKYEVFITRDTKSWYPNFSDYFTVHGNEIKQWQESSELNASKIVSTASSSISVVNAAPAEVALRLYGITKWANENNIDLVLHIHINDDADHRKNVAGDYSGIAIYTPAMQYSNGSSTKQIADAVFSRLSQYNPVSNFPSESNGIVVDPELIAVGVYNTAISASMLIEYDYIYQPQFLISQTRTLALKDFAYQTYLGLQDYFDKINGVSSYLPYNPSFLYKWNTPVTGKYSASKNIYALQTAMILAGVYPPAGKNMNDCPRSGIFGICTKTSLLSFQIKNGIKNESYGGKKTFKMLSAVYMSGK